MNTQVGGGSPDPGPPQPSQVATSLPPDSPNLGPEGAQSIDEAIKDRRFRRLFRVPIVVAILAILATFTGNLTYVVYSVTCAYKTAIDTHVQASLTHIKQVQEQVAQAPSKTASQSVAKSSSKAASGPEVTPLSGRDPTPIQTIFGEMKDSLIPIVGLVSILAAAIVVMLVTLVRASFAPDKPIYSKHDEQENYAIPVPLVEALKSLVDAIKGIFGK